MRTSFSLACLIAFSTPALADGQLLNFVPTYSTFLGGSGWEIVQGIHVDKDGNILLAGHTSSRDFPVTPNAFDTVFDEGPDPRGTVDNRDGFVAKLSPDGKKVLWATLLGGSRRDDVYAVRTDRAGNIYAVGATGSPDFPTTPGAYDETFNGPINPNGLGDIFLTKFSPKGELLFSTFIGGSTKNKRDEENPRGAIFVDSERERIYVAGMTSSADFPVTSGAFQTSYAGGKYDAFVFAMSTDGTTLLYSTFIGGSGDDSAPTSLLMHPDGSIYIGGATSSPDLPVTENAFQRRLASGKASENWWDNGDGFAARISAELDELIYLTYLGGDNLDFVSHNQGMAIDSNGQLVVAGGTRSSDFPEVGGASEFGAKGKLDVFIAVLSEDGSRLIRATRIGGSAADGLSGVFVDDQDRVYFTGFTKSSDWPVTPNALSTRLTNSAGESSSLERLFSWVNGPQEVVPDGIFSVLSSDLGTLLYSTYLGGSGPVTDYFERGQAMWIANTGETYIGGLTNSTDFPLFGDSVQKRVLGDIDGFFIRFEQRP